MFLVVLVTMVSRAFATSVTLVWDPPSESIPSGYFVYCGEAAGDYSSKFDVGSATSYTATDLVEGTTYHFAATSYDSTHYEGGLSNDVSATVPYKIPVAEFSASTSSGSAPLGLNFVNTSVGNITSYVWTFGDGADGTAANPAHVYSVAGLYTVSLTVTGPGGSDTRTCSNCVNVLAGEADDLMYRPGRTAGVPNDLRPPDRKFRSMPSALPGSRE